MSVNGLSPHRSSLLVRARNLRTRIQAALLSRKYHSLLNQLLHQIVTEIRQDNTPEALALWTKIQRIFPKAPKVYQTVARVLRESSRLEYADIILNEGTRKFPRNFDLWLEYAEIAMERRDVGAAEARWAEIVSRFPNQAAGYSGSGQALIWAGKLDDAESVLLLGRSRFSDDLWSALLYAEVATLRQDWSEAHHRWQTVRSIDPSQVLPWEKMGKCLKELDRIAEAETILAEAITRFPDNEVLAILYTEVICERRSWPETYRAWTDFSRHFPDFQTKHRSQRTQLRARISLNRPIHGTAPAQLCRPEHEQWLCGVVISEDPIVILADDRCFEIVRHTAEFYHDREVYYLVGMLWTASADSAVRRQYVDEYREISQSYPNLKITILANDEAELQTMRALSIPCLLINQNIFCDEDIFKIIDVPIRYDAVYTARIGGYKRHSLASALKSLLLVVTLATDDQIITAQELLPDAVIANLCDGHLHNLEATEVAQALNSARCGLCLSAVEGAMFASMEYLLCGLPIVTTQNSGGRNWFFRDDYVFYCEDDATSVKAAVETAVERAQSQEFREYVRRQTIHQVTQERQRFYALVDEIFARNGQPQRRIEPEFKQLFHDKMNYRGRPIGELLVP